MFNYFKGVNSSNDEVDLCLDDVMPNMQTVNNASLNKERSLQEINYARYLKIIRLMVWMMY